MNFQFDLDAIFPEDLMLIGRDLTPQLVDGNLNASTPSEYYRRNFCKLDPSSRLCLGEVLDQMGAASARAQGLQQVISTMEKLRTSENHIIYIITHKATDREVGGADVCVGFLKVGRKRLFILDSSSCQNEVLPVSVLDFYVHESLQRHGYGKQLFDAMLQNEGVQPAHLAIDRPSHKLTSFLAKHYGLLEPCPQVNNYVVYPGFFSDRDDDLLFRRQCVAPDHRKVAAPWCVTLGPVPGCRPGGARDRRRPGSLVPAARSHPPGHREPEIGAAQGRGLLPPPERSASALVASKSQQETECCPGSVSDCQRPWRLRCCASEQRSSPVRPGSRLDRSIETAPPARTSASSPSLGCAAVTEQGSSGPAAVSSDARPPAAVDTSVGASVYSAAAVLPLPQMDSSRLHAAITRHPPAARRWSARRPVQDTPFATLPSCTDLAPPSEPAPDTVPAGCDRGHAVDAADTTPSSPKPKESSPAGDVTCAPSSSPVPAAVSQLAPGRRSVSPPASRHQSPWQRRPSPLRFCRSWSPRRPACCPPSSAPVPAFSANFPWMISKDELFYPNKRTSPGKGSNKVISMLDKNGSANGPPAYSRHAHNGSHLSASPASSPCQGRRELRNLHDHHQLW